MVNEITAFLPALKNNKKISLFALLKMDDLTDRWSILVSGPDLKKIENRKKLFNDIVKLLSEHSDSLEKQSIARIGIFPLQDHLVEDIRKHDEGSEFENEKANGNFIHKGHVLINTTK